ncbi:MAG: transposase [Chloroflexi bacterium]|nr:transposase [Chloroflexota bacterium]
MLTALNVQTVEEAWKVVEAYRKRWEVEEFFRLFKASLGGFRSSRRASWWLYGNL